MRRVLLNWAVCSAIVLAGATVTAGVVFARRTPATPEDKAQKIVNVGVQVLREKTVEDHFTVTGSIEPWEEVQLSAETSGKIEWQGVDAGDVVEPGEELLKINRVSTEIRLNQARAQYKLALLDLDRVRKLEEGGISSPQLLDRALVDRDVALANVKTKEIEFESSVVTAPFSGVVDKVYQSKDEYVGVGTPLVCLIQVNKLKMVVGIADQDIPYFSIGDPVTVVVDAYRDRTFSGNIYRLARRAETATHTFETEIALDNPGEELKPGMIARAMLVRNRYPNSITIPVFSILTDRNALYVFVENDGVASMRPIKVGFYQGNLALVAEGLASGDRLIIAGHRNLRNKSLVRVREIAE